MPRLAIYGDLGVDNAQSLSKLQKEVQGGMYDAILHVGKVVTSNDFYLSVVSTLLLSFTTRFLIVCGRS